jgi:hypothetical protein
MRLWTFACPGSFPDEKVDQKNERNKNAKGNDVGIPYTELSDDISSDNVAISVSFSLYSTVAKYIPDITTDNHHDGTQSHDSTSLMNVNQIRHHWC